MFGGVNHSKLKSNLKVAIQRLKLLEKKKTENAKKSTGEIAEYIKIGKIDRAKIKVEHIIREDYMVEGMEIIEMYCDLLLARFGLLESMKELDLGLYECVSSLLWVTPRLESECAELRIIADELTHKYGKEFANMCRTNANNKVNERLMMKMSEQAPGDLLVEKYLVEIAKSHNVPYKPNPDISIRDPNFFYEYTDHVRKNSGAGGGAGASADTNTKPPQVSHIGFYEAPRVTRGQSDLQAKDIIFPAIPETINIPPPPSSQFGSTRPSGGPEDSFDDLTSRFNQLKKN